MDAAAEKLMEMISNASPELWALIVRQGTVLLIQKVILILLLPICFFACRTVARRCSVGLADSNIDTEEVWLIARFICWIGMAVCGIWFLHSIIMLVSISMNPHYYAIRALLPVGG